MTEEAPEAYLRAERAYHEAGHAVVAHRLGEHVVGLTIERGGSFNEEWFEAYTHIEFDEDRFLADAGGTIERYVLIGLAGALGEQVAGRQRGIFDQGGTPSPDLLYVSRGG